MHGSSFRFRHALKEAVTAKDQANDLAENWAYTKAHTRANDEAKRASNMDEGAFQYV